MAVDAAGHQAARLGHDAERAAQPQEDRDREGVAAEDQPGRERAQCRRQIAARQEGDRRNQQRNKSWQGTTVGDNGWLYFSREVVNVVMSIKGTVAYTASN